MAKTGMTVGLIKALTDPADPAVITEAVEGWLDDHPEASTTVEDGSITKAKLDSNLAGAIDDVGDLKIAIDNSRVTTLDATPLASGAIIEAVGIPVYVEDVTDYAAYGLTETGWYLFVRIAAKGNVVVSAQTTVSGAAGYIATVGAAYVDAAVKFGVASVSQPVTVTWSAGNVDTFVFKATDLAIRNLDYRVTFYVYDAAPFTTWSFALTTDTTFAADKTYYIKDGDVYTPAEVTPGDEVAENTYYQHSKVSFAGMTRNVTYKLDEIVDCPMEFVLPEIEDETHGCWFEIRLRNAGTNSMNLVLEDNDAKIATEHTQAEKAGINMINLHYTAVAGEKLWRFMNTNSTIPAEGGASA